MEMLSEQVKIVLAKAGQAEATTDVSGDIIDMAGFDNVCFVCTIATANAANYLFAQQGAAANLSDAAALADSGVVTEADGMVAILDIRRPRERYLRPMVERGGAATATGDLYAILYNGMSGPQDNTVDDLKKAVILTSPAEGDAVAS